ncbi:MAG: tetratricopeptide repeat protein [Cytophagaceae bacterium]|nr:tetratricopeptide repeat protein [Cytophagaceae bacterium]
MEYWVFLPLFFFGVCCPAQSDLTFQWSASHRQAYLHILDLKINAAQVLISAGSTAEPENLLWDYLANTCEAADVFVSEDPIKYKNYSQQYEKRIDKLEDSKSTSEWKRFVIGELKMQHGALKLKFKEEMEALYLLRQAFKMLEEQRKEFPDFLPAYKTLGSLHILFGSIPDKYLWITDLIGVKADIKTGLDYLSKVEKSNTDFREEASLLLTVFHNFVLNYPDNRLHVLELQIKSRPQSLLFRYIYATLLIKHSQGAKALETLTSMQVGSEYPAFPYLSLLKAELYLYKGQYKDARKEFQTYLKQFKGKNSIKDAWLKIALCYLFEGNEKEARSALQEVLKVGQEVYDSDKYAQRIAETGELPDKVLSQVRFYTDGGYYTEAEKLLATISSSNYHRKKDKLEYYYRTARLYHKQGKWSDAKTYYEKTIQLNGDDSFYFAPNAALQLGYILENEKNKTAAKEYFEKALKYKNHEYKNSIDNKAKAALNRLKE